MQRILITGAAGFIGSHLSDRLIELGHTILAIDNLSSGYEKNFIHHIQKKHPYKILFKDIQSPEIEQEFKSFRPEIVFHLAAKPGVPYSVKNPRISDESNINGTVNLLELSRKYDVKKFIFSSSSSVYGGSSILPTPENTPLNPKSPYALQKKVGEEYCKLFSEQYGLQTVCLRYFNIIGPRQSNQSEYAAVVAAFAKCLINKTKPIIYGDGTQYRDFCPVENVVQANILAATCDKKMLGDIFNIACGGTISINELHKKIGCLPAKYLPERPGDVKQSLADISRAQQVLGYKVDTNFENGLKNTIEWYIKNA